jgi:mono/diheme cytochrome c family protein
MPAYGNRLDSDQIQKLVAYVRTFHADAAAPK